MVSWSGDGHDPSCYPSPHDARKSKCGPARVFLKPTNRHGPLSADSIDTSGSVGLSIRLLTIIVKQCSSECALYFKLGCRITSANCSPVTLVAVGRFRPSCFMRVRPGMLQVPMWIKHTDSTLAISYPATITLL